MATKADTLAAKQRKQKMILIVGGVLFLALAALQGPKLWKQLHPAAPAAKPAAKAASGAPAGTASAVAARVVPADVPKSQATSLAGVVVVTEQPAKATDSQLDSFTQFKVKDPFEQQIVAKAVSTSSGSASTTPARSTPAPATPGTSVGATATSSGILGALPGATPVKPAAPTAAIMKVNGVMQALQLKARFPKGDPVFVLLSLKRGIARIGVVGGSYANGSKAITIRVGKRVTLLNTATGVRYVIRLVYVGADASSLMGFAAPASTPTAKAK